VPSAAPGPSSTVSVHTAQRCIRVGAITLDVTVDARLKAALDDALVGYDALTRSPADLPVHVRPCLRVGLAIGMTEAPSQGLPSRSRFALRDGVLEDHCVSWDARLAFDRPLAHATADFQLRDLSRFGSELATAFYRMWLAGVLRVVLAQVAPHINALLLHAAAMVDLHGRGVVFTGASGDGKTTMTRRLSGWRVLSDDAAFLQRTATGWTVSGTPIPGRERGPRSAETVPLVAVYFLDKSAPQLTISPLSNATAFARALHRILYFAAPDDALVTLTHNLVTEVPTHRLASALEHDVASALRLHLDGGG